jgi:hypothetical protein
MLQPSLERDSKPQFQSGKISKRYSTKQQEKHLKTEEKMAPILGNG